jgi:hypothetical protein
LCALENTISFVHFNDYSIGFVPSMEGTILFLPWKEQFCSFHEVLLPSMEGRRTEGLRQRPQSVKRLLGLSRQKVQFNPPPTIK